MKIGNQIFVGDAYRTNPLSQVDGGVTIEIIFTNGTSKIYDKIKSVKKYIKSLGDLKFVSDIKVDGKSIRFNDFKYSNEKT